MPKDMNEIRPAEAGAFPKLDVPDERGDHRCCASQRRTVPAQPFADQPPNGNRHPFVGEGESFRALPTILALWRQRQDLLRASGRLDLQAQAICRRYSDGDKVAGAKLWGAVQKGAVEGPLNMVLMPYTSAMAPLDTAKTALEKTLGKLAMKHPLWTWAQGVRGLGAGSLAGLLGEAGRELHDYRSPAALWKRMGLAVIDGGRQRRVKGDEALAHGYSAERRAFAFVLSVSLMRSQGEAGPYRAVYDTRKAYELARDVPKAHAHNRALRYMVKRLLRDAWTASRKADP